MGRRAFNEGGPVELLNSPTTTWSHWPRGSTVCFLPREAAVRVLGMHPHFWIWDFPVSVVLLQYLYTAQIDKLLYNFLLHFQY
jgi:hypothetical protein